MDEGPSFSRNVIEEEDYNSCHEHAVQELTQFVSSDLNNGV